MNTPHPDTKGGALTGEAEPDQFARKQGETASEFLKRMHALHDQALKGPQ